MSTADSSRRAFIPGQSPTYGPFEGDRVSVDSYWVVAVDRLSGKATTVHPYFLDADEADAEAVRRRSARVFTVVVGRRD